MRRLDLEECLNAELDDAYYLKMLLTQAVEELKVYRDYFYEHRASPYDGWAVHTGMMDFQKGIWDVMEFRGEDVEASVKLYEESK